MNTQTKIEAPPNVYKRLSSARLKFHSLKLKKSGKFPNGRGEYFELSDYLVDGLRVFDECGLSESTTFTPDTATMRVVNVDNEDNYIDFTSPMGSANLKGCHEVQNIGAVETYQRRYLWQIALQIVEHDALEQTTGQVDQSSNSDREMPDTEWAKLVQMVEATSANVPAMLKHLNISLPDNNLRLLGQEQYGRVIDALSDKLAKMAKDETDAKVKDDA